MADFQEYIIWGLAAVCAVTGWFARQLYYSVNKLKDDLNEFSLSVVKNYIHKNDFQIFRGELLDFMHRLENKIDKINDSKR